MVHRFCQLFCILRLYHGAEHVQQGTFQFVPLNVSKCVPSLLTGGAPAPCVPVTSIVPHWTAVVSIIIFQSQSCHIVLWRFTRFFCCADDGFFDPSTTYIRGMVRAAQRHPVKSAVVGKRHPGRFPSDFLRKGDENFRQAAVVQQGAYTPPSIETQAPAGQNKPFSVGAPLYTYSFLRMPLRQKIKLPT